MTCLVQLSSAKVHLFKEFYQFQQVSYLKKNSVLVDNNRYRKSSEMCFAL